MKNNKEFKEKLIKKSFQLARRIIALIDRFPNKRSAWVIGDQLVRSITSIGANIIEAQAASSKRDFVNFLNHSLKSANEAKFWLALAKDISPKEKKEIDSLLKEVDELSKILGSSIATMRGNF